jgi:hypothetical protein
MISLFLPCFTLAFDYSPSNYEHYSSIFSFHINKMLNRNFGTPHPVRSGKMYSQSMSLLNKQIARP